MILTILIFIGILAILVLVHEFGHFYVAKKSGMVVHEFGFGFPPRLVGVKKINNKWKVVWGHQKSISDSEINQGDESTLYSINLIPLGGFVRIMGENNEQEDNPKSFINKPFWPRLFTLVAGVFMNVVLAWFLFTIGFAVGLPVAIDSPDQIPSGANFTNARVAIIEVVKGLPAEKAGLKPGDVILKLNNQPIQTMQEVRDYIKNNAGSQILFNINRAQENLNIEVSSEKNPLPGEGPTGIALASLGTMRFAWYLAPWQGLKTTVVALKNVTVGIFQLVTGKLGLSAVGGPVKIAQLVGQARQSGFFHLLNLTTMLSLSLAVLNILPFPALDGGRVLFLVIEKIRGKRNNQKLEQFVNTAGFVFLLLIMVLVTIKDVRGV
jgi:regulator of sigma E protease